MKYLFDDDFSVGSPKPRNRNFHASTKTSAREIPPAFVYGALFLFVVLAFIALALPAQAGQVAASVYTTALSELIHPDIDLCYRNTGEGFEEGVCNYGATHLLGRRAGAFKVMQRKIEGFIYEAQDPWRDTVQGTDLGLPVRVGGKTMYFFGDTIPAPRWNVQENKMEYSGAIMGMPWGYDLDGDTRIDWIESAPNKSGTGYDYISVSEVAQFDISTNQGSPFTLFNQEEVEHMFLEDHVFPREVGFFVPTGLTALDDRYVLFWYGKYINNCQCDQSHLLSLDTQTGQWKYHSFFADRKFIQIAPVEVSAGSFEAAPDSCEPPFADGQERGFLLYGAGRPEENLYGFDEIVPGMQEFCAKTIQPGYRASALYLAYVSLEDIATAGSDLRSRIWYYTGPEGDCWVRGDVDQAQPVVADEEFGEFSVTPIPGTDYLLMLHSTPFNSLRARIGHKSSPAVWSEALGNDALGYGNYTVPGSVRLMPRVKLADGSVKTNLLFFKRVISTWKGALLDPLFLEYGSSIVWSVMEADDLIDQVRPDLVEQALLRR